MPLFVPCLERGDVLRKTPLFLCRLGTLNPISEVFSRAVGWCRVIIKSRGSIVGSENGLTLHSEIIFSSQSFTNRRSKDNNEYNNNTTLWC